MLSQVRHFFQQRGVLEVDTPLLQATAPVDPYIDIFETTCGHYLHSSPEYAMKKLLARGAPDIYQLGHVYRRGEKGRLHNPVFTMIEWYRIGMSFKDLIEETLDLIGLFIEAPIERLSHQQALALATNHTNDLHYDWAMEVEPNMTQKTLTVVTDFPPQEAALAKVIDGKAQRFEIYYEGIELANGYDELIDPEELLTRFEHANTLRAHPLPIDHELLSLLSDIPPCVGVAVGFDRCLMLQHHQNNLHEILYNKMTAKK